MSFAYTLGPLFWTRDEAVALITPFLTCVYYLHEFCHGEARLLTHVKHPVLTLHTPVALSLLKATQNRFWEPFLDFLFYMWAQEK